MRWGRSDERTGMWDGKVGKNTRKGEGSKERMWRTLKAKRKIVVLFYELWNEQERINRVSRTAKRRQPSLRVRIWQLDRKWNCFTKCWTADMISAAMWCVPKRWKPVRKNCMNWWKVRWVKKIRWVEWKKTSEKIKRVKWKKDELSEKYGVKKLEWLSENNRWIAVIKKHEWKKFMTSEKIDVPKQLDELSEKKLTSWNK